MAITFQSIGTAVGGTTSAAVGFPASVAATDLVLVHVASKPFGTPPGFATAMPLATIASGSVANGSGTGSVNATVAARIADGALAGTEAVTVASGSPTLGVMTRWSLAAGMQWSYAVSIGADTTETGTAVSATGGTVAVVPDDVIVITVAIKDDAPNHTSQAVTIAGATLSAITWSTKVSTATGNQASLYVGRCTVTAGTVTAAPVYTATSSVSGASAASVVFLRLREQTPALPGVIGLYGDPMVEPETHTHNPPVIDSNGARYRIGESNLAHDNNRLLVQRSVDGGITWRSVDWVNHPTATDLEATWVVKAGTEFFTLITRDDTVWLVPFRMSDHATNPDTYGTQEVVDSGLSSSGVVQYCSLVRLSTGDMWCIYADTLNGANNQVGIRKRTAPATYSAKSTFNDGAVNVTGPAAVVGAGDVTYVFYKDKTGDVLYYRTISAAGTVSARVAVASGAAISSQSAPHTNPIYYDDGGVEVIGIAYINDSDILKYREIRGGVLQTEETISTAALTRNPGSTDSQAVVAHLAVDGTTVHAMWSRAADGDLMRDSRVLGVGWGTDTVVWASAGQTGWYIYTDVVQDGSNIKLIYTYDQGTHVDDASNITYNEIVLRAIAGTSDVPRLTRRRLQPILVR